MIEPPTIPDPEPVTGHICGHQEQYGRVVEAGLERCGQCGAILGVAEPAKKEER